MRLNCGAGSCVGAVSIANQAPFGCLNVFGKDHLVKSDGGNVDGSAGLAQRAGLYVSTRTDLVSAIAEELEQIEVWLMFVNELGAKVSSLCVGRDQLGKIYEAC